MGRAARISGGIGLMVAGAAMLVLPGPGLITLAAGVALLRRDVPMVGEWMDAVRARLAGVPLLGLRP